MKSLSVSGNIANELPAVSVFRSLEEASKFFEAGAIRSSAIPDPRRFRGIELRCHRWQVDPLAVLAVRSSFFDDRTVFPAGSIAFDCALLMRGIDHEWHGKPDLCFSAQASNQANQQAMA